MCCRAALALASSLFIMTARSAFADEQAPAERVEFFEKKIRPLLVTHCYGCHSREVKKVKGELYLDTRAGILKGGLSGPALVPGKPDESWLIKAVRHDGKDLRMPPKPKEKLSPAEIADLVAWVKMGAPDPRTEKTAASKTPTVEEGRQFWSFQPLQRLTPPAVKDVSWPITAIDRFVLARLEAKGLKPAAAADRRALIRRATYDLTGLPPTPEEIEAFLKDEAAGAFARVVDRLLASPAYGERWGRYWLDVVRYADTAGDNSDYPIPQMYKYRNWVIDAFNRDMPYDRFVREQIAGDLITASPEVERIASPSEKQERPGDPSSGRIVATGYLANSRRHGSYEDARYPWYLTIEDTLDNLGKAFLGMTLGCARCHDHKFDPLSAEDYYGLYGFFSSTRYPWPGIELDRVPKDLVPLQSGPAIEKITKERHEKIADFDAAIKRLEAEKAAFEKAVKSNRPRDERERTLLAKPKQHLDALTQAIKAAKKERETFAKTPLPFETAYAVIDGKNEPKKRIGQIGDARLMIKGDPDRLGKTVPRRFPLVLGGQALARDARGSGRLQLAHWLTDPANPLTARVLVNRIWQYHFGKGIVATPNDFGKQGLRPTHPELLDYLADRFIAAGWSIKAMHRLIMLSRVYQLSSQDDEANLKIDVGNDYLWRYSRRRLDAEAIRDSLLAVSGNLDRSSAGPHPFPPQTTWDFTQHKPFKAVYETNRRSVYLMTQRIQRHPFLALFDGPDTNASTATRTVTTTPLQALFLMNDPFVHEQARKFAARLLREGRDDAARIERAFVLAFGRPATAGERGQALDYMQRAAETLRGANLSAEQATVRRWESFARAVFMSNEFIYMP